MIFSVFVYSHSSRVTSQSELMTPFAFDPPQSRHLKRPPSSGSTTMVEHKKSRGLFDLPPELLAHVFLVLPWKQLVLCRVVSPHPPPSSLSFKCFVRCANDSTRSSPPPQRLTTKLNSPLPGTKMAQPSARHRSLSDSNACVKHKRDG